MNEPKEINMRESVNGKSGIVTVDNWTMAEDGERYSYFWATRWELVTDADMGKGFRSTEHWQLWGYDKKDKLRITLPGCQVKGFVFTDKCPDRPSCKEF